MTSAVCQYAVRGSSQGCPDAQLITHGTACDEEGGFFAGQLGHVFFERDGGGVLGEDIVVEGAGLNGGEHGSGGGGYGITCWIFSVSIIIAKKNPNA